jgi:hypothetical protein
VVTFITNDVLPTVNEILSVVQPVVEKITSSISEKMPLIRQTIEKAMTLIKNIIDTVWPHIKEIVLTVMKGIVAVIDAAWPAISGAIDAAMKVIGGIIDVAWPAIQVVIETVMGAIQTIVSTVWPAISGIVQTATGAISTAVGGLNALIDTVSWIFNGIKSAIENPIESAKSFIEGIIRDIENAFSWMHIEIPDFDLPHIEWDWSEVGPVSVPTNFRINWYGQGGFADDGATLSGYGQRGLEMYWPGYEPYFDKYARGIAEHMPNNGGVVINVNEMNVREEADIRRVAAELNTLMNRQAAGGFA